MLANWKRRNNNSPNRLIPKSDIALVHFVPLCVSNRKKKVTWLASL